MDATAKKSYAEFLKRYDVHDTDFARSRWIFANPLLSKDPRPRELIFKEIAEKIAPGWFEWHLWTNRLIAALCSHRWCGFMGCSDSAKTYNFTGFACVWWLCDPAESSVILCSTSIKMFRKRSWSKVYKFWEKVSKAVGAEYGNMVDSQTVWKFKKGDDEHGIYGIAVEDGPVDKIATRIQGVHTRRQLVGIDEAEAVPAAIWKACANLYRFPSANGEFILGAKGNPRSRLSQFGRFCEPEKGYDSVGLDTEEWHGTPQLDGDKAFITRFDFLKSPNIIARKKVSRYLPTAEAVQKRLDKLKASGGENDPDHWAFDRGFPAPEGLLKTVFSETLLIAHHAYDRHEFSGTNFQIIGVFDPAYSGDRPTVRFAAMGELLTGQIGIELMPPIVIYTDASKKDEPVSYQMVRKCEALCQKVEYRSNIYTCSMADFAFDSAGIGAGFADIADQQWAEHGNVIRIQFGGACSAEPISHEDGRLAKDVYRNKRSEMHWRTAAALASGQWKGLDRDTAAELCALQIKPGLPLTLEEKPEYKKRTAVSPDLADTAVMIVEVARLKGFKITAVGHTAKRASEMDSLLNKVVHLYDEREAYRQENLDMEDVGYMDA
jgi:hypothetical protein